MNRKNYRSIFITMTQWLPGALLVVVAVALYFGRKQFAGRVAQTNQE